VISEKTSAAGVTVDGVLLKDSGVVTGAGTASAPVYSTTGDTNTGIFFPAADTIAFAEGGAEAMRIDSSGKLLTNGASNTYGTAGSLSLNGGSGSATDVELRVGNTLYSYLYTSGADVQLASVTSIPLRFLTNDSEKARITSGGEFLVGTTTAGAGIGFGTRLAVSSTGEPAVIKFDVQSPNVSTSAFVARIWNSGASLDNKFMEFATESSYTGRGNIDYNRSGGVVRYNTSSDATLKNIIGDSDGQKSVDILNSTRIREFAWKDDETQKPQIGVIAQELHETYKGAVSVGGDYEVTIPAVTEQRLVSEAILDEDGNEIEAAVYETVEVEPERTETQYRPWGVDKTAFTFHLVAGWQAHEKIIKQQADMIAALEARIAALEQA
jgi:hypothetical protein